MLDILLGILCGLFLGLVPGVHPNLMAVVFVGFGARFVVSAALAQVVSGMLLLVLFGLPCESVLAVHPVERLRRRGLAREALKLLLVGCVIGVVVCALLTPLFLLVVPLIERIVHPFVYLLLVSAVVVLLLYEPSIKRKCGAVLVFLLSGLLGVVVFSSDVVEPLLVLFSGLFAVPGLFVSLFSGNKWVVQRRSDVLRLSGGQLGLAVGGGVVSVLLLSFIPALSMSQASLLASFVVRMSRYGFLVVVGCVAVLDYYFSFLFAVLFGRTRSGVFEVLGPSNFSFENVWGFVGVLVFAVCVSVVVVLFLFQYFERAVRLFPVRFVFGGVFLFLVGLVLVVSGSSGLVVLGGASLIGVLAVIFGVSRSHLMGCLVVPLLVRLAGL